MRRNDNFSLVKIADSYYLLPYGQMIADQKHGIKTNETGVFIWNALAKDLTEQELLQICADEFCSPQCTREELTEDIRDFLARLSYYGMLTNIRSPESSPFYGIFTIAGLKIKMTGPAECFSKNFEPFRTDDAESSLQKIDQTVRIIPHAPSLCENGTLLLRNSELFIIDAKDRYLFLFPMYQNIAEASVSKDGSAANIYCRLPYDEELRENLFHAIRSIFLYLAWMHGMAVIHSASFLYRDRVWLFSGHSGMGKSTHTNLWHSLYDVPLINGDLNLFTSENTTPVVKGIPWCGTSGIFDTKTYPLGGIILLNQHPYDEVIELSPDKKRLLVLQRLISPSWTSEMLHKNLSLVDNTADQILICKLRCTKNNSAAEIMKKYIDDFLKV